MPNSSSPDGKDHGIDHVVGPMRRLMQIGKRIVEELTHDDLSGVAAQMTYYFMLALFPALILLVGLLDALPLEENVSGIVSSMFSGLPEDVASMLTRYVNEFATRRPPGSLVLWIVASLWATSRGIRGARKGLNRVFRCKPTKNVIIIRLQDVGLTVAGLLLMGLAYLLLIGGKQLGAIVVNLVGLDLSIQVLWIWLRLPVTMLLMTCFVVLVYRYLPSRRVAFRPLIAGALPTVVAWMLLGSVFRFWLRHLGNFDEIYGGLTSFFLLMFLLWLVSLVLLLGGEVTARLDDRIAERPETVIPPDAEEQLRNKGDD
ncbi:MAG: YihY/virulence factor BrkB family protein [Planctomycetota bacterium]|jgi:membrane protein|nr:YihY/virulence factor BrkB family protein [Planctomycetota bacterium]